MSARRAVLVTLAAVVVILGALAAGMIAVRKYEDVRDRAEKAEREVARLSKRPQDVTRFEDGANGIYVMMGIADQGVDVYGHEKPKGPAWYAVLVTPNSASKIVCCAIQDSTKMQPCHNYFWTPGDRRVLWRSNEKSADADC